MALTVVCDFCDKTIGGGIILRYRRSIFEFLRILPKLITSGFQLNYGSELRIDKYYVCDRCKRLIEHHIFAEPNVVEELQRLCQNNVPRFRMAIPTAAPRRVAAYPIDEPTQPAEAVEEWRFDDVRPVAQTAAE